MSSISESATCATTSAFRPHRRLRRTGASTSAALSPLTNPRASLCSAGARPQAIALTIDSAMLASSTRRSSWKGRTTGNSLGTLSVWKNRIAAYATAMPPRPPRHASIRLSVNSSRISRKRPAPMRQPDGDLARSRARRGSKEGPRRWCTRPAARRARGRRRSRRTSSSRRIVARAHFEVRAYSRAAIAIDLGVVALRSPARCTASSLRAAAGSRRP